MLRSSLELIVKNDTTPRDAWADCTFEGAELATVRQGAKLTFAEKIAWLEDMHRMALRFQEARRKKGRRTIFPDGRIED